MSSPLSWIKVSCDLHDKPQVEAIRWRVKARTCFEVVGMLARVWSFAERQSRAGVLAHCRLESIDRMVGRKGFGQAMVDVNWLRVDGPEQLSIPAYDSYMGAASREREAATERQRASRERDKTVTHPLQPRDGGVTEPLRCRDKNVTQEREEEEEREEEKTPESPHPPAGGDSADADREISGTLAGHSADESRTDPGQPAGKSARPPAPKSPRKPASRKAEDVPIPPTLDTPAFRAAWLDWIRWRAAEKKTTVTPTAAERTLAKCERWGVEKSLRALARAVENDHTGVYDPGEERPAGGARASPAKQTLAEKRDELMREHGYE